MLLGSRASRLGVVLGCVLAMVGCSGGQRDHGTADQTLRINIYSQPKSLDPAMAPGPYGPNAIIRQYSEPLLKVGTDGTMLVGAAAERFDVSPDGLTYRFHLAAGGRYNDGQPVRPEDFVYAWRRLADPRTRAPLARVFTGHLRGGSALAGLDPADAPKIEAALDGLGLKALDDTTFEVTLADPIVFFPRIATLTSGSPVRRDVVEHEGAGWATSARTLVTNGPFEVASIAQGESVTLEPNPYFRDKPRLRRIVAYELGADANAGWARYLDNGLDISNGPPAPAISAALGQPGRRSQATQRAEASVSYIEFNTTKPPFDDPRVRLAFARSVDRTAYAKVGIGLVTLAPRASFVPDGVGGSSPGSGEQQAFDPEGARALLASSGVARNRLQGIHLLTRPFNSVSATFVQDQLKKNLGVDVTIDPAEDAAVRVSHGDFQMWIDGYFGAPFPDASQFFDVFLSGGPANHSRWSDARYDELVKRADVATAPDERARLYGEAEKRLVESAPAAFMGQVIRYFWVKPWVRGITRTPDDDADFPGDVYTSRIFVDGS